MQRTMGEIARKYNEDRDKILDRIHRGLVSASMSGIEYYPKPWDELNLDESADLGSVKAYLNLYPEPNHPAAPSPVVLVDPAKLKEMREKIVHNMGEHADGPGLTDVGHIDIFQNNEGRITGYAGKNYISRGDYISSIEKDK